MKIGCIGQGFIGKNMADDFESRGYDVVRYALEPIYAKNKELIKTCDIIFIAVPTPSSSKGCDYSVVEEVIALCGEGSIVVIKSTILPGTTMKIQTVYPDHILLFSPEFLSEVSAAADAAKPMCNIVGLPSEKALHTSAAEKVHSVLPESEHNFTVSAQSAELFKYVHNVHGYMRVILSNIMYDAASEVYAQWEDVTSMIDIDPMMSPYYNSPVHKGGRGAGGNCFVKDMAAFRHFYREVLSNDESALEVLQAMEKKNLELLAVSGKSQDLVASVYGTKE